MNNIPQKRIDSIDVFKFIAILGVIWIHAEPLKFLLEAYPPHSTLKTLSHVILILCRMAVPFFFVVSGYFLHTFLTNNRPISDYLKRLLKIFVVWSIFYMVLPTYHYYDVLEFGWLRAIYWSWLHVYKELILDPLRLITVGGKFHLWFIWSLAWGSFLLKIFHTYKKIRWGLLIGVLLYAFALSQRSYSLYFTFETGFKFQHGPFVSLIFLILGYMVARQKDTTRHAWMLTILGFMIMLIERMYLVHVGENAGLRYEFLIGTIPCSIGLLKLALKYPELGKNSLFADWGKMTLGIYVSHMFILEGLFIVRDFIPGIGWVILLPVLTFCISLVFVTFMLKNKYLHVYIK